MKEYKEVLKIIVDKIKKDYKDDIALLASNDSNASRNDGVDSYSFYFIPMTEKGNQLSIQFLIDGVSYDLFPMQWERLVANASMDSPQWYIFFETEIVYCGDEKSLERFEDLKKGLELLLKGDSYEIRINKAYEYFNESYIYLYNMNRYIDDLKSVRLEGGKLLEKIATALAFVNVNYAQGTGYLIEESLSMKTLPDNYKELVDGIVFAGSSEELLSNARLLIDKTRDLLLSLRSSKIQKEPYETIFTGYYEEMKRYLDKCSKAVASGNYYNIFEFGSYLLEEIGQFKTKVDEGIWYDNRNAYIEYCKSVDINQQTLLNAIASRNNEDILQAIDKIENGLLQIIKDHDLVLLNFESVGNFKEYLMNNR